jgi:STE24 endopeptidase
MDGSRRSGHSNAFFTGVGKFRRIVLFDTLIEQMDPRQTEAVLAHEIGHWKLGHIPRLLLVGAATSLLGFWLLWQLIQQPVLFEAFGFGGGSVAAALALVVALSGTFTFWAGPLGNLLSRRHEYQADAYAKRVLGDGLPLAEALRLLTEKNLSNPSPHPAYSVFYHSHPTASERERALLG